MLQYIQEGSARAVVIELRGYRLMRRFSSLLNVHRLASSALASVGDLYGLSSFLIQLLLFFLVLYLKYATTTTLRFAVLHCTDEFEFIRSPPPPCAQCASPHGRPSSYCLSVIDILLFLSKKRVEKDPPPFYFAPLHSRNRQKGIPQCDDSLFLFGCHFLPDSTTGPTG